MHVQIHCTIKCYIQFYIVILWDGGSSSSSPNLISLLTVGPSNTLHEKSELSICHVQASAAVGATPVHRAEDTTPSSVLKNKGF